MIFPFKKCDTSLLLDAPNSAFHDCGAENGRAKNPPFDGLCPKRSSQGRALFPVCTQNGGQALPTLGEGLRQQFSADHCAADPLKGACTDQPRRLSDEKSAISARLKITIASWTGHQTRLCSLGTVKRNSEKISESLFLFLKRFPTTLRLKRTAKNQITVLSDRPRAAIARFGIKNAGIRRQLLPPPLKILLNGNILLRNTLKKASANDGARSVRPYKCVGSDRTVSLVAHKPQVKGSLLSFRLHASGVDPFHRCRHAREKPTVKRIAVHIEVVSLIVPDVSARKVYGLNVKNLRIGKNVLWECESEARKNPLRVGSKQPSAHLSSLLALSVHQ